MRSWKMLSMFMLTPLTSVDKSAPGWSWSFHTRLSAAVSGNALKNASEPPSMIFHWV